MLPKPIYEIQTVGLIAFLNRQTCSKILNMAGFRLELFKVLFRPSFCAVIEIPNR